MEDSKPLDPVFKFKLIVFFVVGLVIVTGGLFYLLFDKPPEETGYNMPVEIIGNTFNDPQYCIEKYRINIMAFGAVGDGKTYDDEAYKAALKEVERRGLPLYFPTAHYKFHRLYFPDCDGAKLEFENSLVDLDSYRVVVQPDQPIRELTIKGMQLHPHYEHGKKL